MKPIEIIKRGLIKTCDYSRSVRISYTGNGAFTYAMACLHPDAIVLRDKTDRCDEHCLPNDWADCPLNKEAK